jgi:hypothetical protein
VLDRDEDVLRYHGAYVDFHPRVDASLCELDRAAVKRMAVDPLIDVRLPDGSIRLGQISYLPRRLTEFFLSMYRRAVQILEIRLDQLLAGGGSAGEIAAIMNEIAALQTNIGQLEAFHGRLDAIEDGSGHADS